MSYKPFYLLPLPLRKIVRIIDVKDIGPAISDGRMVERVPALLN